MSQLSTGLSDSERKQRHGADRSSDDKPNPLAGYYTEAELSHLLKKGQRTLRKWRLAGEGPPFAKLGVTIIYPIAGVDKWLARRVQTPARAR
jgi:hypothetical protein